MSTESLIQSTIQTLGLPGLALGGALEGETVAFMAGVLVHRGLFGFEAAVLAVSLGAVLADNLVFVMARRGQGSGFVQRSLQRPMVRWLRSVVDRNRVLAILAFRFLYGMKTAGCVVMATTGIGWLRFALWDLLAVLIWAHVLVGLGYAAGTAVKAVFGELRLHWHLLLCLGIFLACGALYWLWAHRLKGALPPGSAG